MNDSSLDHVCQKTNDMIIFLRRRYFLIGTYTGHAIGPTCHYATFFACCQAACVCHYDVTDFVFVAKQRRSATNTISMTSTQANTIITSLSYHVTSRSSSLTVYDVMYTHSHCADTSTTRLVLRYTAGIPNGLESRQVVVVVSNVDGNRGCGSLQTKCETI